MTMSRVGEWTDEEVQQIEYIVKPDIQSHTGFATFVEDDEWEVLSVDRRLESRSIVDAKLSRLADGKRINFELRADNRDEEWGNSSKLTDQVFWLSIILMEYVGIFGIEDLDDCYTVRLIPRRSVYDFRPPDSVGPAPESSASTQTPIPLHRTTPLPQED
jgi:hypothetical protein